MRYPLKTLDQLSLLLKGFRKTQGLTQSAMAERLGITQQSYAHFEANPSSATVERLFMVLRLLGVEITLDQADLPSGAIPIPITPKGVKRNPAGRTASKVSIRKAASIAPKKPERITSTSRKKEGW